MVLVYVLQALGTTEIGVPGYGDLASYSSLWEQHHGPGTALGYHGSHPELLGFASELWSSTPHNNNGHARAQCMIQQRYDHVLSTFRPTLSVCFSSICKGLGVHPS